MCGASSLIVADSDSFEPGDAPSPQSWFHASVGVHSPAWKVACISFPHAGHVEFAL
jgi:hypothetical protein